MAKIDVLFMKADRKTAKSMGAKYTLKKKTQNKPKKAK